MFGSDCPPGSRAQLAASLAATAELAGVNDSACMPGPMRWIYFPAWGA